MRTRDYFMALCLFVFLLNPTNLNAQSIEGYVTHGITGEPLENAEINYALYMTFTGPDGYYILVGLPPGTYDFTCIYGDLCPFDTTLNLFGQGVELDIQLYPCPELIVEPPNIVEVIEPNAQSTEMITLSNPGETSVEWSAELEIFPPGNTDDMFDLIFQMPLSGTMEVGAETDGVYIYTTSPFTGSFYRYDMSGLYIGSFSIGSGIYDLAYDGTYFYGSNGTTTLFVLDLDLEVLISTFSVPQNVKAITYNSDEEVFYGYDWGGDIIIFDNSGALLNAIPVGPNNPVYASFAYDNVSPGSPYLWGYGLVEDDPNVLVQIALPDFLFTGVSVSLSDILQNPVTNGAGGLFVSPDIMPGIFAIAGIVQGEWLWALELAENNQWISIEPISGVLEAGETEEMNVYFDATDLFPWTYEAEIQYSTLPNVGSPVVDVSMIIEGEPWIQNLQTEISCTNIILNWETVPPSMPADSFHVYRDSLLLATTFETQFVDSLVFPEIEHTYYASGYFYNGWESYPTNTVNVTVPIPEDLEPSDLEATILNDSILCFYWGTNACLLPETYNLYRDGELIAVLTEPSYCDTLPMPGFFEYYITATYYFGESGPSDTFYYLWVDASNVTYEKEIRIYPNPVNDELFVESSTVIIQLELLNIHGSNVISEKSGSKEVQLNVSGLEPGIYFLKLETANQIILRKVVVK